MQVRQTGQRILANRLRRPVGVSGEDAQHIKASPEETFWPGISLDLTGATRVDLDLSGVSVRRAAFDKVRFSSAAWFRGADFSDYAGLSGAAFSGDAGFAGATFFSDAWLDQATFSSRAGFEGATFFSDARFDQATFSRDARFAGAHILHLDDPYLNRGGKNARRAWPEGWTVRPDADNPTRGTLISSDTGRR